MVGRKAIVAGAAAVLMAPAANALQLSDDWKARINIETSCAVVANNLNFGSVGVIGGQTATASVVVTCSQGTAFSLSFDSISSVTSYSGVMVNGANTVAYSASLTSAGGSGTVTIPLVGVLLPQSTPPQGIYTDNRMVYLNY